MTTSINRKIVHKKAAHMNDEESFIAPTQKLIPHSKTNSSRAFRPQRIYRENLSFNLNFIDE